MPDLSRYREPSRARRIRQFDRMKERGFRLEMSRFTGYSDWMGEWTDVDGVRHDGVRNDTDAADWARLRGRFSADNLAACSCYGCGNPRRWWKAVTVQEAKADEDACQQMEEAGVPNPLFVRKGRLA